MSDTPQPPAPDEVIVCHVTRWYYKRMGILAAMLLGMGLYFAYDGKYGYRKDNAIVEKKNWFDNVYVKSFDDAKASGKLEEWIAQARAAGLPAGENGEPPKWPPYAAEHGWPEETKKHSEEEIYQQFEWAGAMLLGAVAVLAKLLLDRGKTFTGHAQHMVMPNGAEVRFSEVFKVDKRKWANKALAYVHHRRDGVERRATVDDLKYDGAGRVLDRLLAGFSGELIEKVPEEDPVSGARGASGGGEVEKP